jgi:acyl carrier protein
MEKSEIQERIVKVVCDVLNIDAEMVSPESNFVFDLGAESTQSVQLVAAFEEEFDIEMEGEEALAVQTVGEAVDFIEKYVNK